MTIMEAVRAGEDIATATWTQWLRMWNEDAAVAQDIIAPRYRLHLPDAAATIDPATITTPTAMQGWVEAFTGKFDGLRYATDWGPMFGADRFAYRWIGTATWKGETGWPLDIAGAPVLFVGIDVFRIVDGKIAECWSQGAVTKTL